MVGLVFFTITNILTKSNETSFEDMFSLETLSQLDEDTHNSAVVTYGNKTYEANYLVETEPDGTRQIVIFAKEIHLEDTPKGH